MHKGFWFASAVVAMSLCSSANIAASERGAHIGWQVRQPVRLMVSAVLRKNGTTDVIKPVHGIVTAETNESAVAIFVKTASAQYSGYTLIATLASPVPAAGRCENSI